MPYAFLIVTAVGALGVLNAYRPVRHEPWSVPSFFAGWLTGELAIQNIVWEVAATVVFCLYGALHGWAGWVGLGLAVVGWVGLVGLAVSGFRAGAVAQAALTESTGPALRLPVDPEPHRWGTWWRVTQAIPLRSRKTEMVRNIDYWGDGIRRHRLDVIRSKVAASSEPAPVMIYIHGGAWVIGNKEQQGKPMLYELVARGWVCVSINYRLSPKATWPEHVVDCKRAIAWVKEHIADHGGDPGFVALSGGSAGGHLCALAALTAGVTEWQPGFERADTSVDACIPFYGVMDMTGERSGSGKYGPGLRKLLEDRVMKVHGPEHADVFVQASPTERVHAGAPPFFVLHGVNDTLVPVEVARSFVAALRSVSTAPVAYAELPLAQHAFDVLASLRCLGTTGAVAAFLDAIRASRAPGSSGTPAAPGTSEALRTAPATEARAAAEPNLT